MLLFSYLTWGNLEKTSLIVNSPLDDSSVLGTFSPAPTPPIKQPAYGVPVRLKIPKLGIDANVIEVGITDTGNMDVPQTLEEVGWYKYGPKPGEKGSAVIDGHLGVGERGVFVELNKLQAGDHIFVDDENGQTTSFIVRETKIYDRLEHPDEVFVSKDGAHLNLITCSGDWISSIQATPNRLVVFTDLVK